MIYAILSMVDNASQELSIYFYTGLHIFSKLEVTFRFIGRGIAAQFFCTA